MKQLTFLSGKGGTGKTTVAASFAVLAENAVVADGDVEASKLPLVLHPGVDAVLLVTEPTVAGKHDLERVLAVAGYFGVETLVGINRHDLNAAHTAELHRFCESNEIPVVGEIPLDPAVTRAPIAGEPVVAADESSPAAAALRGMWSRVRERVG